MKKNLAGMVVAMTALITFAYAPSASADTLEVLKEQQEHKQVEIDSLMREMNTVMEEVSILSTKMAELDQEIDGKQVEIETAEKEVHDQEKIVEERLEQARQRLQSLQLNETNQNIVLTILEAQSLGDLLNRAVVIMRLTDAGNQQLELAQEEVQVLVELNENLLTAQAELQNSREVAQEQKADYDEKVASLQALIRDNEAQLNTLVEREAAEEARIEEARRVARAEAARAAARREAEERAAAEQQSSEQEVSISSTSSSTAQASASAPTESSQTASASSSSSRSSNSNSSSSSRSSNSTASAPAQESSSAPAEESSSQQSSGRTLRMQATGYSTRQPSLSTHTATGIDLRVNPRVIAVDPSIIPLGTMVEVEGMGVYIAGDTGGAIRGNIIDIHFQTVAEALQWGRRTVNVRILD
ncbi:Cell wall-binding protein [Alkalibacterium sp. AK22]|uniref:3D domain-containing protein n=1 Tax=Alkalibacterium sp. AK22 TaxID=1229520 RepID=UPI00044E5BD0|nr:3D domain-containing protein [Alkalibacterium sp. AK22]EXJ23011.1 Cell wall-binding protein [Alkalibacterium sp. AK22]